MLGWVWVGGGGCFDGDADTSFDVPGTACFGAGFELCTEDAVAGFVPLGGAEEFGTVEPAGFAMPDPGTSVDFTWPGISDDAVTG